MAANATRPELLLHADFVRGLARALVGADGEDVAQQVWVRALQAAPPRGDVRAFLTTIVRRLAQNRLRSERRRSAREGAAVAAEPGPTPDQVLAREEVRRRVVDAVLALDEPFRQVVLLRFYDDLTPRAIAQRLGVPPATVRTRLLRALDKLRARLDAEHGGSRAAWTAPLLPWLGMRSQVALPAMVLVMKKVLVIAAVAASLFVALLALRLSAVSPGSAAPGALAMEADMKSAARKPDAAPSAQPVADERARVAATPIVLDGRYPADRRLASLRGAVVDDGGQPVAGVAVSLRPWLNLLPAGL